MKTSVLFLIAVLAFSNLAYSQNIGLGQRQEKFLDKMYLKAGIDLSSISNDKLQVNKIEWSDFWGSVAYDYSNNLQIELVYKLIGDRLYHITDIDNGIFPRYYRYSKYDNFFSHSINLKADYFIQKDKTVDPIYLTTSFSFDLQRVSNIEILDSGMYGSRDIKGHYYNNYHLISFYDRVLFGSSVGVGMFFAFGRIDFQIECSFSAKIAPFVNRGFKEYAFNISLAPVYKF